MPGAPNRPPESAAAPVPPAPVPPELRVLRRIVPSQVALLQPSWKGAVPAEVLAPFDKADAAFRAGDFAAATLALDQLSIRFAEPRWPTLAEPYRRLRVPIPAPVPPHWDPDHGLATPEKEARQARRLAEEQLALAEGCVAWASANGVTTDGLPPAVDAAKAALGSPGVASAFYEAIDPLWRALRERLPAPKRAAGAAPAAAVADEA
jgi:hypothetical protein